MKALLLIIAAAFLGVFGWQYVQKDTTVVIVPTDEAVTEQETEEKATTGIFSDAVSKAKEVTESIETKSGAVIDLSNQGLTKAPENIFDKTLTTELNLSHNNIGGALQAEVRLLAGLRVLDLSYNNFTGVPAEIGQLKNLEVLNLSNNKITGLPHELGNLSKLKVLNLSGNSVSQFDLDIIKKSLPAGVSIIE